jgi:hypothetical protein
MGDHREARSEQEVVAFLRELLQERVPAIRCEYDPQSPLAYGYPQVQEFFGLSARDSLELLEDLVAEGALERRLVDKVHLCPNCTWHTLNFVEVCPRCRSIDVEIEEVIHHFACAYVGPVTEFRDGVSLACPKCEDQLRHMGMDYDRPADTYICRGCGYVFTESRVEARCMRCRESSPAEQVHARRIFEYAPTAKASRAIEYGRLHGLDMKSVLLQEGTQTFRQDFMVFEIDREIYRSRRYESPLALILAEVRYPDSVAEADTQELVRLRRAVFDEIAGGLRNLDVVSAIEENWVAVLLPETNTPGALKVARRMQAGVSEFQGISLDQPASMTIAIAELREELETGPAFFEYAHRFFTWALQNRPGQIVTADQWTQEGGDE